jgi:hypothetical protein
MDIIATIDFMMSHPNRFSALMIGPIIGPMIGAMVGLTPAIALPPPQDVPEEVLRAEMIVEARDRSGQPIAPGAYAQLQQTIDRRNQDNPQISEDLQSLLLQLRLLSVIKSVIPFP